MSRSSARSRRKTSSHQGAVGATRRKALDLRLRPSGSRPVDGSSPHRRCVLWCALSRHSPVTTTACPPSSVHLKHAQTSAWCHGIDRRNRGCRSDPRAGRKRHRRRRRRRLHPWRRRLAVFGHRRADQHRHPARQTARRSRSTAPAHSPRAIEIEKFSEFKNSGRTFGYETLPCRRPWHRSSLPERITAPSIWPR